MTDERERLREAVDRDGLYRRIHAIPSLGHYGKAEQCFAITDAVLAALAHDRPSGSVGLREAARRFAEHVTAQGCDHEGATGGTHTGCPERLQLDAPLSGSSDPEAGGLDVETLEALRRVVMGFWEDLPQQYSGHYRLGYSAAISAMERVLDTLLAARLTEAKPETPA